MPPFTIPAYTPVPPLVVYGHYEPDAQQWVTSLRSEATRSVTADILQAETQVRALINYYIAWTRDLYTHNLEGLGDEALRVRKTTFNYAINDARLKDVLDEAQKAPLK